ncbi:YSIRK-type signal peptide-containing protein [Helcococcus bovis]|uniref:YSIRK-type signal peptide-containing protein n=1 Tax=Helcococcus bovis TaxID=3153252 RepID=UPI0038BA9604
MNREKFEKIISSKKVNRKYSYSIRKLSIGVASVVMGAFLVFGPVNFSGLQKNVFAYTEADRVNPSEGQDIALYMEKGGPDYFRLTLRLTGNDGLGWRSETPKTVQVVLGTETLNLAFDKNENGIKQYFGVIELSKISENVQPTVKIQYSNGKWSSDDTNKDFYSNIKLPEGVKDSIKKLNLMWKKENKL